MFSPKPLELARMGSTLGAHWEHGSPCPGGNLSSWARRKDHVDRCCDLNRFVFILMHKVALKHIGASVLTFLLVPVLLGRTSRFWRCREVLVLRIRILSPRSRCVLMSITSLAMKATFSGNVCGWSANPCASLIVSLPIKY